MRVSARSQEPIRQPVGPGQARAATRMTMPLAEPDATVKVPTLLCPAIVVKGKRLHALVHCAAPLPAKLLRRRIDNVATQGSALVSAMGAVLSGI